MNMLPENHLEYIMEMVEERVLFTAESELSFVKYGFNSLGFLTFRHFRTYVFPNFWRSLLSSLFCFIKKLCAMNLEITKDHAYKQWLFLLGNVSQIGLYSKGTLRQQYYKSSSIFSNFP